MRERDTDADDTGADNTGADDGEPSSLVTDGSHGNSRAITAGATGGGDALITVCPDGPLLVRGDVRIVDATGAVIPANRPTIALCRCGKSPIAPLCDGTHKLLRSRQAPR